MHFPNARLHCFCLPLWNIHSGKLNTVAGIQSVLTNSYDCRPPVNFKPSLLSTKQYNNTVFTSAVDKMHFLVTIQYWSLCNCTLAWEIEMLWCGSGFAYECCMCSSNKLYLFINFLIMCQLFYPIFLYNSECPIMLPRHRNPPQQLHSI